MWCKKALAMNKLYLLFLIGGLVAKFSIAQEVDYNTKNGYVAKGYDVVSYFDGKPVKGKKQYAYAFDGANFKFANEENREKFKLHPNKYIPQYGGWCAYAMGTNGTKYGINPKSFEIRNDKLYLFYKIPLSNTLNKWLAKEPDSLRAKADKNWAKFFSGN